MVDPENKDLQKPTGFPPETSAGNSLQSSGDPPTVMHAPSFGSAPGSGSSKGREGSTLHRSNSNSGDHERQAQMPQPGIRLGGYELGPSIGTGGMATVYAARDLSLERTVALKILPPDSALDNEVLQRFLQEGKSAAQLDHPNIARIYAIGHDSGYYYLVFEFIEGRTIRQWIEDSGKIDVEKVLRWSIQIADALAHADHRGVVHRDVKPSNLIVTRDGTVKLVDLGLARRYETHGHADLTQSGVTLGTFDYISPEQARDPRNVDIRSDLYSLGCTMFHMLAGVPPFPGQNVVQKLLQHQEQAPPDLHLLNPDVPRQLCDLISRLMAKFPGDRPPAAEICAHELRLIERTMPVDGGLTHYSEPNRFWSTAPGVFNWLSTLLVIALIIATGGLVMTLRQNQQLQGGKVGPSIVSFAPVPAAIHRDESANATDSGVPVVDTKLVAAKVVSVKSTKELCEAFASATPGTTIFISSEEPLEIEAGVLPELFRTDLTLRAQAGTSPIIKVISMTDDGAQNEPELTLEKSLFRFRESRVQIQGIKFDIRGSIGNEINEVVRAQSCDLLIRDCGFISDNVSSIDLASYIHILRSAKDEVIGWCPTRVETCQFFGARLMVRASGPVDLSLSNSAKIGSEPVVWVDQPENNEEWPCQIQMDHLSVMATGWTPMFELNNSIPRIRVQNSIFAPRPGGQISLVSCRSPKQLDWFGRNNVYGEVTVFLETVRFSEEILEFPAWRESGGVTREQNSMATSLSVFGPVDSQILALQDRWADAFTMNPGPWQSMSAGVKSWSISKRLTTTEIAFNQSPSGNATEKPVSTIPLEVVAKSDLPKTGAVEKATEKPLNNNLEAVTKADAGASVDNKNEIVVSNQNNASGSKNVEIKPPVQEVSKEDVRKTPAGPVNDHVSFSAMIKENEKSGTTLNLAKDANIQLQSILQFTTGKWQINADAGEKRPKIDLSTIKGIAGTTLVKVAGGASLRFRGIDFIWQSADPKISRIFELENGAQLTLEDCTITVVSDDEQTVIFRISELHDQVFTNTQKTFLRVIDSIVRTAGKVIEVEANTRSELELANSLVVSGNALISLMSVEQMQSAQNTRMQLTQSTAILKTSLADISIANRVLDLPRLQIQARRTILASQPENSKALIDVRGGEPNQIQNETLFWDGDEVAYDQWTYYRTDMNDMSGQMMKRQNREEWQLNHASNDTQAVHANLKFKDNFWTTGKPLWQAEAVDFEQDELSAGIGLGARLERLPTSSMLVGQAAAENASGKSP
jgi:serine/threonine-protein kinase